MFKERDVTKLKYEQNPHKKKHCAILSIREMLHTQQLDKENALCGSSFQGEREVKRCYKL